MKVNKWKSINKSMYGSQLDYKYTLPHGGFHAQQRRIYKTANYNIPKGFRIQLIFIVQFVLINLVVKIHVIHDHVQHHLDFFSSVV